MMTHGAFVSDEISRISVEASQERDYHVDRRAATVRKQKNHNVSFWFNGSVMQQGGANDVKKRRRCQ
jgi:hypothetical protein